MLKPVNQSRGEWHEMFKINFNSKTKYMLKVRVPARPSFDAPD
jgi:hypothetical protein